MAFQAVIDGPVVGMRWTAIAADDGIVDVVLRWQGPTKHPAQVDRWRKMLQRRQQRYSAAAGTLPVTTACTANY